VEADGRVLKWDFRDRLVEVLEPERGSESRYVYDAAGQRVIKEVTRRGRKEWVLYVDRHFEVREGDAPIKYVYLGETRVAQVKGTLDPTRPRIQRLRLVQGWNLAALAVSPAIMTARTIFGLGDDNKVAAVLSTRRRGDAGGAVLDPCPRAQDQAARRRLRESGSQHRTPPRGRTQRRRLAAAREPRSAAGIPRPRAALVFRRARWRLAHEELHRRRRR
jgi:YD repeat-containing protein